MNLRHFSFGGGVQSVSILILAAQGHVDFPVFIFSHVGDDSENPATLRYLDEIARPYADAHDITLTVLPYRLSKGPRKGQIITIYKEVIGPNRTVCIPVHLPGGGPGNRHCTVEFKMKLIARWQRKQGATSEHPAVCGIGFSTDEVQRLRTSSRFDFQRLEYPLIDLNLSRSDCKKIITDAGLPMPQKSSCWFCPYHSTPDWITMRRNNPDLFARAITFEQDIIKKRISLGRDPAYLHRSCVPLADAIGMQPALIEELPCDTGACFT